MCQQAVLIPTLFCIEGLDENPLVPAISFNTGLIAFFSFFSSAI